jgi:hypothetical protein
MTANTVYVKNISGETSEKEIKDFFSFCGKIADIKVTSAGATQDAEVVFEKETAAKTALLLDNTQLGKTQVSVSGAATKETDDYTPNADRDTDEITQEEKPRSRIIAEYLAHGYAIGDVAAQRAIELDHKHGVSNRFLQTLHNLDTKFKATDKAKTIDQSYGVTNTAQNLFNSLASYYEKAAATPTGQKFVNFYTQSQRDILDIHKEARRLADLKKQEAAAACTCDPGHCKCAEKGKSNLKTISLTDKTVCSCGGKASECTCENGHCVCSSCPKTEKGTCSSGGNYSECTLRDDKAACSSCSKVNKVEVPRSEKAVCGCTGDGDCTCEKGKCVCKNCSK